MTVEDAREAAGCIPARPRALSLDAFASGVIVPLNPHEDVDGLGSPIASVTEPATGTRIHNALKVGIHIFHAVAAVTNILFPSMSDMGLLHVVCLFLLFVVVSLVTETAAFDPSDSQHPVQMHEFLGVAPPPNLLTETRKRIRTSSDGLGRFTRALHKEIQTRHHISVKESFELVNYS
jgi:hypothetical protein